MAKATPLQQVKDVHGGKEKLVDKLVGILDLDGESKTDITDRLRAAPNSKLLRLFDTANAVKDRFGGKAGLVDNLLGLMNRAKDEDYKEKLLAYSPTRLLDMLSSWEKKAKKA